MRLTIKVKLIGGFLIVVALLLAVFGIAYNGISTMEGAAEEMNMRYTDSMELLEMETYMRAQYGWQADLIINDSEAAIAGFDGAVEAMDEHKAVGTAAADTAEELAWVEQLNAADAAFDNLFHNEIVPAWRAGDMELVRELDGQSDALLVEMVAVTDKMVDSYVAEAHEAQESAVSAASSATVMTIAMSLIAAVIAVGLGFWLSQSISKGVGTMLKAAEGIAQGDVNQTVNVKSKDEIGDMAVAFTGMIGYVQEMAGAAETIANGDLTVEVQPKSDKDALGNAFVNMTQSLRGLIGQATTASNSLIEASGQLSSASEQAGQATQGIASTSQQVAKGAEEQSQSVQGTTSSMEQLSKAIDQIAQGAQEQARGIQQASGVVNQVSSASEQVATSSQGAAEGSRNAAEAAQGGAETVGKTIDGMQKIMSAMALASQKVTDLGDRSNEIGKIVATIDDIAAQTNLLALNAAIEAARAGEQGRGFAVVADEVRKLAERSSMATKEIADLITGIQSGVGDAVSAMEEGNTEVQAGNELAGEAGEALKSILEASTGVSSQIEQISAAAEELQASSTELVKVIDGVSSVVEESTAATEQMAANSTEVTKSLESVAGISEQNSAATQEISASAEEMSAQVQQVVASSQSLSEMATDLQKAVSAFKI